MLSTFSAEKSSLDLMEGYLLFQLKNKTVIWNFPKLRLYFLKKSIALVLFHSQDNVHNQSVFNIWFQFVVLMRSNILSSVILLFHCYGIFLSQMHSSFSFLRRLWPADLEFPVILHERRTGYFSDIFHKHHDWWL